VSTEENSRDGEREGCNMEWSYGAVKEPNKIAYKKLVASNTPKLWKKKKKKKEKKKQI
jgi:UDP-N-acetyl-D-mannosaminuronic acid transferase (WecB/TagA/CpsF family)